MDATSVIFEASGGNIVPFDYALVDGIGHLRRDGEKWISDDGRVFMIVVVDGTMHIKEE